MSRSASGPPSPGLAGPASAAIRRILVVRLRLIGDVVFTTPAIAALKHHYPHAHLAYVVEPAAAEVVRGLPAIDELIIAPRVRGWRQTVADLRLGTQFRRAGFDLALDFHGGPRSSLLTWLSGAPTRIGYTIKGRAWMYTVQVPRARELRPRHSVENQWDLLTPLGIPAPDREQFPTAMALDAAAQRQVAVRLQDAGVGPQHRLIVLHVSAGNPFRRWPLEHFTSLVASLASTDRARRIVVTSGPSERDASHAVIAAAQARLPVEARARIVSCGEFSLAEVRALCDTAALYIGGDSGPLHVASTTRVPIVGLYGPTLPIRSEPWRSTMCVAEAVEVEGLACRPCDQRVCEPGDFRCLSRIESAEVVAAAERALVRSAGKMIGTP